MKYQCSHSSGPKKSPDMNCSAFNVFLLDSNERTKNLARAESLRGCSSPECRGRPPRCKGSDGQLPPEKRPSGQRPTNKFEWFERRFPYVVFSSIVSVLPHVVFSFPVSVPSLEKSCDPSLSPLFRS